MEVTVNWIGDMAFDAVSGSGHTIKLDGPPEAGGKNQGARPMEMLLIGMGACSSVDVISIIKKSRLQVIDCEVKVAAERAEDHPKIFTHIHLHFIVKGKKLKEKVVERAIHLSAEKYCSATIMLGAMAEITHDFEMIELD